MLLRRHEGTEGRSTTIRIGINLTTVWIERGHLRRESALLEESQKSLESIFTQSSPPDFIDCFLNTVPLCIGYRGLTRHLAGDHVAAEADYRDAIVRLRSLDRNHAIENFSRFLADLLTAQGDVEGANAALFEAEEAATGLQQLDLVHAIYLSKAKALLRVRDRGETEGTHREIDHLLRQSMSYASEMGLYRLKAEGLTLSAAAWFERGDLKQARRDAMESLSIATYHGMILRKLSAMTILGRIFTQSGQIDAGASLFKEAQRAGQRIGYHRLVQSAFIAKNA
ncbi:MAG: hypothetical protein AAF788_00140 [Pseudomonadota bacterium]